jgi:putative transposase
MVVLEFRLAGKPRQYRAIDEAIRTTQFIRNKCVRYWQDTRGVTPPGMAESHAWGEGTRYSSQETGWSKAAR